MKLVHDIPNSLSRHNRSSLIYKVREVLYKMDMDDPKSPKVIYFCGDSGLTDKEILTLRAALSNMLFNGPVKYRGIRVTTATGDYIGKGGKREFYIQRLQ